jgi:hypothetical protein
MLIRDAIHDYIEVDGEFSTLVDTPQFQRLRWIRQLGTGYLVYPGANHTRYEHSLGAYQLASRLSKYLELDDDEDRAVRAAALLHDMGHGPLSHVSEEVSLNLLGKSHEDWSCEILCAEPIGGILEGMDLSPAEIASIIRGEGKLGQMVSGEIDVDRMDYLCRDAYYTGVTSGSDLGRILVTLRMVDDTLAISESGLAAAEGLLVSRFLMYPTVYFHHTCRIAELMLVRGVEDLIGGGLKVGDVMAMDDVDLLSTMRSSDGLAKEVIDRIGRRDLYKRAVKVEGVDPRKLEEEITDELGIDDNLIIVDELPIRSFDLGKIMVLMRDGKMVKMSNLSSFAPMSPQPKEVWVYCPEDIRDVVAETASKIDF